MVAPKPVPSRAALNALRGLVFTTSCSVVLLAEERRRRSKLARAAIDNARKLHTVKARRRPVALVDAQLSDTDLELFNLHRVSGAPTRKKRSRKPRESTSVAEDGAHNPRYLGSSATTAQAPDHLQRETSPIKAVRDSIDYLEAQLAQMNTKISSISGKDLDRDFHRRAVLRSSLRPSEIPHLTEKQPVRRGGSSVSPGSPRPVELADKDAVDALSTEVVQFLQSLSSLDSLEKSQKTHASYLLNRLLNGFESSATGHDLALTYQTLILQLFKTLSLQKRLATGSTARKLRFQSLRFMKVCAQDQSMDMTDMFNTVGPFYPNIRQMVVPLLHELNESNNFEGMRQALQALSNSSQAFIIDSGSITEVLKYHLERYKDLGATCRFYNALHNPELASVVDVSLNSHYEMHRMLLNEACSHGDGQACVEQAKKLNQIDHGRASRCASICISTLILDAKAGRPMPVNDILDQVDRTDFADNQMAISSLAALVDTYSQHLRPSELETLMRSLVEKHGMELKYPLVHAIAEYHADNLDQDSMLSWLQFCVQRGYLAALTSLQKLSRKFVHQWHWGDEEMAYLLGNALQAQPPTLQAEDWETCYIRRAEGLRAGTPAHIDHNDFNGMKGDASKGDWASVWALHEARLSSGAPFSLRCLCLAVMARLKLDNGATEMTNKLIGDAKAEGQDVSEVLTPLLMAQLEEGKRGPDVTIRDALQQGFKIHDMIYNKAAVMAAASGDRAMSIRICKLAATQNGKGDLLYNPYNFASLLYGYTGLQQYNALEYLISRFTEKKRWWSGIKVTLQSLKLAMKAVAERAATAKFPWEAKGHEKILRQLSDAHQHGFACKRAPCDNTGLLDSLADIYQTSMGTVPGDGDQKSSKELDKSQEGPRVRTPSKTRDWDHNRPALSYTTVKTRDIRQQNVSLGWHDENHVVASPGDRREAAVAS